MSTHHKIMKITFAIVCYTLSCFASEETLNPPRDEFDEAIGMGVLIGRATYCKAPEEKLELAGESVLRWIILQTKDDKTTTHKDNL